MKIMLLIISLFTFFSHTVEVPQKHYEIAGYSITLPETFPKYCDITISDNKSTLYIRLKESHDLVAAISVTPSDGFYTNLGQKVLLEHDENIIYISLPTCGTLNDESKRFIWNSLLKECENITEESISPLS